MSSRRPKVEGPGSQGGLPNLSSLPSRLRQGVSAARAIATSRRVSLYLVGGVVRDLLLRRSIVDVDLAVEEDGAAFGRALARRLGVRVRVHERFGTATLAPEGKLRLDVASTRSETYDSPGALPRVVSGAALERDLARRDFTINAMAIRIAPGRRRLIDPFQGRKDLEKGLVRMLHPASAMDDPTRAFRAVRYANRLGFSIERRTREWISDAVRAGAFRAVSGDRLRRELRLLFSEPNPARAVLLLSKLELAGVLDPHLAVGRGVISSLRRAETISRRHPGKAGWTLYLLTWAGNLDRDSIVRLVGRLSATGREKSVLLEWPVDRVRLSKAAASGAPAAAIASRFPAEGIAAAAALERGTRSRRLEQALSAQAVTLTVGGRDLLAAGVPAGPRVGKALEATLSALRDGRISRREELAFAIREATAGEAS